MGLYRGEFVPGHPTFPTASVAACGVAAGPVSIEAADIRYAPEDEEILEMYTRNSGESICGIVFGYQ